MTTFPEPHGTWRISTSGGTHPRWGRDGRDLFCLQGPSLVAATIEAGAAGLRVAAVRRLFDVPFRTGASYQYVVSPDGGRFLVHVLDEASALAPLTVVTDWRADVRR